MLPDPRRIRANCVWSLAGAFVLMAGMGLCAVAAWAQAHWAAWVLFPAAPLTAWAAYRHWTSRWRRRAAVLAQPFPQVWEAILRERVAYYTRLSEEERERFRRMLTVFLDEKPVVGPPEILDETTRVLVGASAVIPVFGFPAWEYDMLDEVMIHPGGFDATMNDRDGLDLRASGMVGGSGIWNGVMILSQPDLLRGFAIQGDKHNVGIHEFAHLVDKATGHVDGVPVSLPAKLFRPWLSLVKREIEKGRAGRDDDIPDYGFTSEEEFFAVTSEYFFDDPDGLRDKHATLYGMMEDIFRQDTAKRFDGLRQRMWRPVRHRTRRNAPCPCGSGRKYKRCCGRKRR